MGTLDDFFGKQTVQQNKEKRKAQAPAAPVAAKKVKVEETPKRVNKPQLKRENVDENGSDDEITAKSISGNLDTVALTAEDVLKTIPDADPSLLELDPDAENLNFFQLKAKQKANQSTSAGSLDIESIPKGRDNCLNGLSIVFTGSLPRLDRSQCEQLAARYGARIVKSISGKTSLVVIGHDAGPSKVKKIKQLKIKCIDEKGFIDLITKMPADGGAGDVAKKELDKKKQLEEKAERDALEDMETEERQEKERLEKLSLLKNSINSTGSSSKPINIEKEPIDKSTQLWTDKYAPTDIKHICGNKSNVETLYSWLEHWFEKPHDMKGSSIDSFKAVLISGPPGIGKTTAATLISKKLGYDVIEKNASDYRSKKLLNENLRVCLDNTSVNGFFNDATKNEANSKKIVLLMDEVDGMSSGDNGGVAQIAQFCRITKTPMILICNDKSLPKMRPLDKVCYDLVWRRPTAREMKARLMTIAHREGLKLDPNLVEKLVSITHNDIRQIINIMSTVARTQKSLNFDNLNDMQDSWEKEVSLKPFDIIAKLLSSNKYSINEKIQLYFNDMDIIPLMIHENYRITKPNKGGNKLQDLIQVEKAADLISQSDEVNSKIRSGEQQWSLLPLHAIMSTVYPAYQIEGQITNRINFTSWLGQNSKRMKFERIVQNLQYHTCTKTKTNNVDLRLDYIPFMRNKLLDPLVTKGSDGIPQLLELMDEYYLTKEDFDNIMELQVNGTMKVDDVYKKIPTSVKSAFTRKYNSYVHPTMIYKTGDSIGKGTRGNSLMGLEEEEGESLDAGAVDDESGNEDSGIEKDNLIKEVKRKNTSKLSRPKAKPRPKRS
ncbi:hypothetical protein CANINC_003087 [Pichia inconspicua]|uniref:Replication factor C subunit 1 n=1 Tax=Pichia inconspicua TaxID=52247 RepID=A0A4T0X0Q4_9ASCO|nr:hypothetical protein CANINC_003087 [[Candida] inconspicua]